MAKLYLVPTPIGNLGDITLRAIETLKTVDLVLAEDTRTSGKLFKHYEISTHLQSHHMHNEHKTAESYAERIANGENIALISDAGTPAISDPGFLLVRTCIEKGVEVECLPGATAFVPALVISGLPSDRFIFEGFLPHKKGRKKRLESLADESRSIVFYESPYRIKKSIEQFIEFFGPDRNAAVVREISKMFESVNRGTLLELKQQIEDKKLIEKGEFVIIIGAKEK
jgi:16S rRNA (cytidine1402-2'-O)-methyltransferase